MAREMKDALRMPNPNPSPRPSPNPNPNPNWKDALRMQQDRDGLARSRKIEIESAKLMQAKKKSATLKPDP